MTDYYDGPRRGVADCGGAPHLYESLFKDDVGYLDTYLLTPISPELFELALEDWEIWLRWQTAYHTGLTSLDTHPALPGDRDRHDQLAVILKEQLVTDKVNHLCANGEFRARSDQDGSTGSVRGVGPSLVRWTVIGD